MKKIRFPRIRKGYGKLVSVLRRRGGRKRTEQLPEVLLEAERCEDEKFAVEQHEDELRENEHHGKAEACNQQQCPLREFCLKKFSEKRDAHAAGGASPDKAKR